MPILQSELDTTAYKSTDSTLGALNVEDAVNEVVRLSVSTGIESGEDIAVGDCCVILAGKAYLADKDTVVHLREPKYIASNTVVIGELVNLRKNGNLLHIPVWGLVPNVSYFIGNSGIISTVIPTTGFIQKIGVAITDEKLEICTGESIQL